MNCLRFCRAFLCFTLLTITFVSTSSFVALSGAEDWPQWRGANRDGKLSSDVELVDQLPPGELPREWTVAIGPGYSGPTVADGRVFVTDRQTGDGSESFERVLCFDAATGKSLWTHRYAAPYTIQYTAGPRAAVTVVGDRAISAGAMGHLICFKASTGDVIWQHDTEKEFESQLPIWGIAGSPLVHDDLVIQIISGSGGACVAAFDLKTGEKRWQSLDEPAGYSSPIIVRQGNQDVVVCWTGASVSGLDPKSGRVHWSVPMLPRNMPIGVPTPIVDAQRLFVSSFYDGSMLIRLDANEPKAEMLWHRVGIDEKNTDALHSMIGTPIFKGDYIYGVDSYGELRCLKASNGDRVWEDQTAVPRNRWGTIHIFQLPDREILFNDQGDLIFATLSPEGFQEHSRAKLIAPTRLQLNRRGGVTWAHPAISNGMIYARSDEELVCASLRK